MTVSYDRLTEPTVMKQNQPRILPRLNGYVLDERKGSNRKVVPPGTGTATMILR